jgi:hypothetical protein
MSNLADGLSTYAEALEKVREFSAKLDNSAYVNAHTINDLLGELKEIVNGTSGLLVDGFDADVTYLLWTGESAESQVDNIRKAQPGKYAREFDCHVGKLVKDDEFKFALYDLIAAKEGHAGIMEKMDRFLDGTLPDGNRTPASVAWTSEAQSGDHTLTSPPLSPDIAVLTKVENPRIR